MDIAIIGAGRLATILGTAWTRAGHQVSFGLREPADGADLASRLGANARALTMGDAVGPAQVVALAVPWPAYQDAITSIGEAALAGKVVLDCSSAFGKADPNGPPAQLDGEPLSGAERVAAWAGPQAKVVLACNQPGLEVLADPHFDEGRPTQFICGDDHAAKELVATLVGDLGFDACDTGPLRMARYLEPLALVWIDMSRNQKRGTDFALRLMQRGPGLGVPATPEAS